MTQFLISDDPQIIQLFQEVSRSLHIQLEVARSLESVEQSINQSYQAYIFSPMPFDIFPWIAQIREKTAVPIAFIHPPFDISYLQLKETYHINYILDAPLQREEVEALLNSLEGEAKPIPASPLAAKIPQHLKDSYEKSINQKIDRIEGLVKKISEHPSEELFTALKQDIHKIAGSASSYGYPKVSELCQAWEAYLAHKISSSAKPDESLSRTLNHFLRLFKLSFQYLYPDYSSDTISRNFQLEEAEQPFFKKKMGVFINGEAERLKAEDQARLNPIVYIVSTDKQLIEMTKWLVKDRQLEVKAEADPKAALRQLNQHAILPSILIAEHTYPDSIVTGLELVAELKSLSGTAVLILNDDLIEDHMQALDAGVNYVLKRPISREELSYIFNHSFEKKAFPYFKVLLVDDDADVCRFVADSLKEIDVQIETLADETQILDCLKKTHPHLLLLDINLPRYNGWQLLKMIRADVRYRHLSIVLMTTLQSWSAIESDYSESGDEILMKPLNAKSLQTRVAHIASRLAFLESHLDRHPLTGYFNAYLFHLLLRQTIWHALTEETWISLAIVELDNQERLKSSLSLDAFEDIIVKATNLLDFLILKDSLRGYVGSGKFVLIFEGYEAAQVESFIRPFLLEAKRSIHSPAPIPISFSCGIAASKKMHTSIDTLFQGAEEALKKSQIAGGNTVTLHHFATGHLAELETPEIIIIEDDPDILDILIHAYTTYGFKVVPFSTGKKAIQYFSEKRSMQKRSLILLDRRLPDMDGIDLLKKIKKLFPQEIKAIFLTSLSSEKDMLDGLKEGAIDYITKPFNISILLKKTHHILGYENISAQL